MALIILMLSSILGMLINKPFAETTYADFEAVYRVNVFGAAQLIRHLLPFLTTTIMFSTSAVVRC